MIRVASLYLPQLPIERLRQAERPRAQPEAARRLPAPVDDDPGACSVPRGGHWRPGARWANSQDERAHVALEAAALPAHQQPPMRELGRRSEPAAHPFRAMRPDEGVPASHPMSIASNAARSAPTVLVAVSGQRELITAVCPEAHALGLHIGMAATQARAFVVGLAVHPADPDGDGRLLHRLALHAVRHWTPIAEPSPNDGVWLELTGTTHLFGGEERFCRRLIAFCKRAGFTARIAIAGTPGAAHALARYGSAYTTIVPSGGEAQAVASLPLAAFRLTPDALAAASRFGFERVADLFAVPRGPLAKRLGLAAVERLDQALGRKAEPISSVVPFEAPVARRQLLEPIGTAESIALVIGDLISDVVNVLRTRGLGARALDLALLRIDGSEQHVVLGTAQATRDGKHLGRLLGLRIDQIEPGDGIEEMRLTATRAEPLGTIAVASALIEADAHTDIAPLVDVLTGRIGTARIFKASSVESDVPERSVRKIAPLLQAHGWQRWRRPARLLIRPELLDNVVALMPDHPPRRFSWRGKRHRIVCGDGPERVHGEWWRRDGEIWAVRDYYLVEDDAGARFWIFRRGDGVDPETGDLTWHLHGFFG